MNNSVAQTSLSTMHINCRSACVPNQSWNLFCLRKMPCGDIKFNRFLHVYNVQPVLFSREIVCDLSELIDSTSPHCIIDFFGCHGTPRDHSDENSGRILLLGWMNYSKSFDFDSRLWNNNNKITQLRWFALDSNKERYLWNSRLIHNVHRLFDDIHRNYWISFETKHHWLLCCATSMLECVSIWERKNKLTWMCCYDNLPSKV